jgi:F-type H+-transporting ATPase subunit b
MRQWIVLAFVFAWLCLAGTTAHAAAAKEGDKHAEKSKDINIFEPRVDLGIWTIIVFLGLMFVLKKYAWGPMVEGLQKREERIKGALEEAKKARADAERIQAELQKKMDEAAQNIAAMIADARQDGERLKAELKAEGVKEVQTERERAVREIQLAKDQALQDLWQRTAELATLVSVKTVRKQLSVEDHRALIDEALQELKTAGEQHRRYGAL